MTNENGHPDMDYKAHGNTYSGFLNLLKWGTVLTIIAAVAAIIAIT
ncbi:aa3-type cytochrome c oxidase subunit IV [Parasphingopyxis lamellibrachiae]|uniref:Aa3 type cytochrome c oxidase subunit IV n=1 Tax=Parasphingopyxis lamellibrachiae TaxID=680125 RepID=A0A3D9FE24_9SPHN|nr:aa3-type cytochrome c oxidase subunit IV [Parasphingopyxis lamellibrachiae]RED16070.1 aa3 type cytochrome c oxidase subunit IV [Parasphingopyxis lamellibrachiae]